MQNTITQLQRKGASDLIINGKKVTKREMDFIYFLAHGMTAKEIGREIGLSFRTVESGISRLKRKLNCHSRYEIIKRMLENHLTLKQILLLYEKRESL